MSSIQAPAAQPGGASAAASGAARVARAFASGKAFVPFVTCGDPDLETTEELVVAMAGAGADLVELGIPFSDPTAEGPVIQAANLRALAKGVTTDQVFELVGRVRKRTDVPLAFMTYANVPFSFGAERFARRMAETEVDALILPDIPFEEKEEFAAPCRAEGVAFVSLVAPTSHERVQMIAREAEGFVYCVSSLGVTGARENIATDVAALVERVRRARPDIPCAVGFGIATPEQAAAMAAVSDGAIVGSAIVRLVAEHGRACVEPVAAYVRAMKAAVSAVEN
ncbi:tryptophan synthase subunit alpha [Gordonibacter massiliensis (ex Traore et al. 2017)]|uniref:tryptophan synthase subunit alpha n=1 Tax=Gordonibacter massiliensis (ex Traore et al. 2017) TaxID=1841863 RepID=UPI001C8B8C86|nr:tryptophan synthase subunit alpha [Gordonibacter massiliensis (ex Traore et al. 2017)]MBX9034333.1 tryptophan synthase subunit alpha [Gordonibacter massiliensis (ex Traore et al. 2017)]